HRVVVAELLHQGGPDVGFVDISQPGHGIAHRSMISPDALAKRTLRPSPSVLNPTRVGLLVLGSRWATLETWIVDSFSSMPPGEPWVGRLWRLTMLTPCTITRFSAGRTFRISPCLPLSRPVV